METRNINNIIIVKPTNGKKRVNFPLADPDVYDQINLKIGRETKLTELDIPDRIELKEALPETAFPMLSEARNMLDEVGKFSYSETKILNSNTETSVILKEEYRNIPILEVKENNNESIAQSYLFEEPPIVPTTYDDTYEKNWKDMYENMNTQDICKENNLINKNYVATSSNTRPEYEDDSCNFILRKAATRESLLTDDELKFSDDNETYYNLEDEEITETDDELRFRNLYNNLENLRLEARDTSPGLVYISD